jgi:hypothetical protein
MTKHRFSHIAALVVLGAVLSAPTCAAPSVLVLDFGLKDDTLLPNVPDEVARIASFAPYVRSRLRDLGHEVPEIKITPEEQTQIANGYMMAHPEIIQEIGRKAGVPWVVIGYSNKFSFLISWTRGFILDTATGKFVARGEADLRGAMKDSRMTRRSAVNLADQLHNMLATIETRRAARANNNSTAVYAENQKNK